MVASFAHDGASIQTSGVTQVGGETSNDFSSPLTYTVTAGDGTTQDYIVTVTIAAATTPASAQAITAFSFTTANNSAAGIASDVTGTISGTAITATVPYGTTVTGLIPTFTTTGAGVTVGTTTQTSGTTANDFTSVVLYKVTGSDGTSTDYMVTVSIAASSAKDITAFSFTAASNSGAGVSADVTGTISGTAITATVPFGTGTSNLIATFTTTGSRVTVNSTTQTSGTTANDYTNAVTYGVIAADGGTQSYTVTLSIATPAWKLPDTGQTTCWDGSGTVITCPAAGSAMAQDGSYNTVNQPSYVDSDGATTVTDGITGLVWQKASAATYTYANALTYCSGNTAGLAGTGWRLPTKTELSWIIKNEGTTFINPIFTGNIAAPYWNSTPDALDNLNAWSLNFLYGNLGGAVKTLSSGHVRCVSGTSISNTGQYNDNTDSTVTDLANGLVWDQRETTTMSWVNALSYCENLTHAGSSDWRLPNRNELESLVDEIKNAAPTINSTYFPNAVSTFYWTSTTFAHTSTSSWFVNFTNGSTAWNLKNSTFNVRCVR